jgi:hypothetical protein
MAAAVSKLMVSGIDQRRGRDQTLGAVGAQCIEKTGVGDAITDLYVGHPCADGLDHTGRFNPHAVGHRDRVSAIAKVGVGIVQAHRHMTKTNLAWTGIADFDLFITKDFGTTGFVEAYGFGHFFLFSSLKLGVLRRIALIGL